MDVRKFMLGLAAVAAVSSPISASAQTAGVVQGITGVQRASPTDRASNGQFAELGPDFWVFAGMGVVVTGAIIYEVTQDDDGPKSP